MRVNVSWSSVSLSGIWRERCSNCRVFWRWMSLWAGLRAWYGSSRVPDWERKKRSPVLRWEVSFNNHLNERESLNTNNRKSRFRDPRVRDTAGYTNLHLEELSFYLCSLGVLLGQLTATFRANCRFVSVLIYIVTGRVLTPTPSSCCRQSQILKQSAKIIHK